MRFHPHETWCSFPVLSLIPIQYILIPIFFIAILIMKKIPQYSLYMFSFFWELKMLLLELSLKNSMTKFTNKNSSWQGKHISWSIFTFHFKLGNFSAILFLFNWIYFFKLSKNKKKMDKIQKFQSTFFPWRNSHGQY